MISSKSIARLRRLQNYGYFVYHLIGKFYLVRRYSKWGLKWYNKIPIYDIKKMK